MNPEQAIKYISNGMSLRPPQAKSLELFAAYLQSDAGQMVLARMKKDRRGKVEELLASSKEYFSKITETKDFETFERAFPTYTFALATGVGKTRLMGAFVAYMYLVYNVQHFLIVAPNLTIYRKLFDDFSRANNPKYVFRGIQEININTAKVITTDNYTNQRSELFGNQLEINIFNIQQFAQRDMTNERGITKAWETAGESYFDYLKEHEDLVVMLDEAHHYHADAALGALDLMDPLFGLEFTATPYLGTEGTGKKARQIVMKNVLYSYNLGDAIRGGLVKDPWVGTEADVDFREFDGDSIETDARKLQLAAYFHERAKTAIKEYARENNKPDVKPVMLVVAANTAHASELRSFIDSDQFRGGEFKGKVIEVHTKTKGEEVDETIEKLISLEHPDNIVEVVIHVNMLKEGWDVTNIYTIVPLRQSAAMILTEQTIGRGLRLPYGERTGVPLVDRVMIVAHEQYSKVIELAKDSSLIQGRVEQVSNQEMKEIKTLTEIQPIALQSVTEAIRQNSVVTQAVQERAEEFISKIPQIESMEESVKQMAIESKKTEIFQQLAKEAVENQSFLRFHGQVKSELDESSFGTDTLFATFNDEARDELEKIAKSSERAMELRNIPIPRLMLTPHYGELIIPEFDLDTSTLSRFATEATIIEESLQKRDDLTLFGDLVPGRRDSQSTRITSFGSSTIQTPQNIIIAALLDYPLIDYDEQKTLLVRLADQAVSHYRTKALDEANLKLIIETNARTIAKEVYDQFLGHKELKSESYIESSIADAKPFLEQHNISIGTDEKPVSLDSQVDTFSARFIYSGFEKACHPMYKFDSSDEARLAYLLDRDTSVEDWLRPAPIQFDGLRWRNSIGEYHHRYEPDFVVELPTEIVMIEVKPTEEITDVDVQSKKQTAERYCELVSQNIGKYGIRKPWRYVIIPTSRITLHSTIQGLLQ